MTREIKFRYVWKRKEDGHIWLEIVPLGCLEGAGDVPFVHSDSLLWEVIARDQYTGLLDKNGREIYEGDVVYIAGYGRYVAEWPFIQLYESAGENDVEEILGNIHENPELLK